MNKDQLEAIKALVDSNFSTSNEAIMANARHLILSLITEIESLKAITELAVKGLALELNVAIGTQNKHATNRLDKLLSEIEVLQNAHIQPKSTS